MNNAAIFEKKGERWVLCNRLRMPCNMFLLWLGPYQDCKPLVLDPDRLP